MNKNFDFYACDEARWLAAETAAIACDVGLGEDAVARLGALVAKLGNAAFSDGETSMPLAPDELRFVRELAETPENAAFIATAENPGNAILVFDDATAPDAPTLYFRFQFDEETEIAREIIARAAVPPVPISQNAETLIAAGTDAGFNIALSEEQRRAVRTILAERLAIISGGPGTGKTTLLLRALICILVENPNAKILLVAPTGKAAMRIGESLKSQTAVVDAARLDDSVQNALRKIALLEPTTLHRALGLSFVRKTAAAPDADIVVADEASMISQSLMSTLLGALPQNAKLVLLGDKNQLDSVMPGRVFGDFYDAKRLERSRASLVRSHRFSEKNFLGRLAQAVLAGDAGNALKMLGGDVPENVSTGDCTIENYREKIRAVLTATFPQELLKPAADANPKNLLSLLETSRILTPVADGPFGKNSINEIAESLAASSGNGEHFHGRPILITKNERISDGNYLCNGDIGIVLRSRENGRFYAYFSGGNDALRCIPTAQLPPHESAYAITIHKSQGSEFSRLGIFFPPTPAAGFYSRQLLYTALTRFRETSESRLNFRFCGNAVREAILTISGSRGLLSRRLGKAPQS